jgi:hypothetical protein
MQLPQPLCTTFGSPSIQKKCDVMVSAKGMVVTTVFVTWEEDIQ